MELEGDFHDNSDNWKDNFDNGLEGVFLKTRVSMGQRFQQRSPAGFPKAFHWQSFVFGRVARGVCLGRKGKRDLKRDLI